MPTPRPLVSIVIPCFNYGHFLGEAIESALNQTHQPVEVIVVDDGSTDNTREVASRYPIQLISQLNQGSAAATNTGVAAAHGEYVIRLDADDVLYPRFVEQTLQALERTPEAVLAHAAGDYFGQRTGSVPFEPFDAEKLAEGAYATCSALIRRSAWEAVGGLDETIPLCEDWDLWLTFAERGWTGVMLRDVLWGYRVHGPSQVRRPLRTWRDLKREYRLIAGLQENHPTLFAPRALLGRLASLPRRLVARQVSPRSALLITTFYTLMLTRAALRLPQISHAQPRPC